MARQLASIQRIRALAPIPGADKIELATIQGWQVVVKKGEFQPGAPCVYFEIDAILPPRPEFAFLKDRNYRIKTIRLRGQISQGIAFPMSILPPGAPTVEGADLTATLGVNLYLPNIPAHLSGIQKGPFPALVPKTDEVRIQSTPQLLERHRETTFYVTEKIDGSSMTAYLRDGVFGICSRNFELEESGENAYWKMARALDLEGKLKSLPFNAAIQGELFGMGVQGNKYKQTEMRLGVFSLSNLDTRRYLDFADFTTTCARLGLETVPVLDTAFRLPQTVEALLKSAEGSSRLNPALPREGIVLRPLQEASDPDIGRLSFKVINNQFLLTFEE